MSNKVQLKQIHKINKICLEAVGDDKNRHIQSQKTGLDDALKEFISTHFPVQEVDTGKDIELKRELFIFDRKQLDEFVKDLTGQKDYKHEV